MARQMTTTWKASNDPDFVAKMNRVRTCQGNRVSRGCAKIDWLENQSDGTSRDTGHIIEEG